MSIELMNRVMESAEPTGTARMVLLILADRADERGICWPGIDWVAKRAAVAPRTVQRVIRDLEANGWLERETNAGPASQANHRPSLYRLVGLRGDKRDRLGVTSEVVGVTSEVVGVTSEAFRGDTGVTQSVSDPSEIRQDTSARRRAGGGLSVFEAKGDIGTRMLVLNGLFNRRESTRWSADEVKALRAARLDRLPEAEFAAESAAMLEFYRAEVPEAETRRFWRRTELIRVLRHWPAELDKAFGWRDRCEKIAEVAAEGRL